MVSKHSHPSNCSLCILFHFQLPRSIPEYGPAFSFSHSAIFDFFPLPPQPWIPSHGEFLPTLVFWQPSEPSSPQLLQRAPSQPVAALQGCSSLLGAANIKEKVAEQQQLDILKSFMRDYTHMATTELPKCQVLLQLKAPWSTCRNEHL